MMPEHQCAHFSLEVEEVYVSGAPVMLRVPVRRCALAERLIRLIWQQEAGRETARKLMLVSRAEEVGAVADAVQDTSLFRAAFGPDLEAIHAAECTVQRCQESCSPGFKMLLRHFGFEEEADRETGKDCLEANPAK